MPWKVPYFPLLSQFLRHTSQTHSLSLSSDSLNGTHIPQSPKEVRSLGVISDSSLPSHVFNQPTSFIFWILFSFPSVHSGMLSAEGCTGCALSNLRCINLLVAPSRTVPPGVVQWQKALYIPLLSAPITLARTPISGTETA